MKLFHTSDWHLGRMLYGRSLLDDQRHFLRQVFLPAVEREKPACVLLSGDVYDRQIASPEAIQLFDETLARLLELGVQVCAIAGNHDGARRMVLLKSLLRESGVYFATELGDAFSPVVLTEGTQKVQLFPLPYFDAAAAREFLGDETLRGESACMEKLIERLVPLFDPEAVHILLAHCFAAGSVSSDSESGLFVGGAGEIPPSLFAPFDYVALGHLHGPQQAGPNARYSGSPLKYSVDEQHQRKSWCVLTVENNTVAAETVPIPPKRDVRRVEGLFDALLRAGEENPSEDYIEVVLTDEAPVLMAAQRLRPFYPNLLSVSNPWAAAGASGQRAARLKGQNEPTVFGAFCRDVCGFEPEEADRELFRQVLEEVEV